MSLRNWIPGAMDAGPFRFGARVQGEDLRHMRQQLLHRLEGIRERMGPMPGVTDAAELRREIREHVHGGGGPG